MTLRYFIGKLKIANYFSYVTYRCCFSIGSWRLTLLIRFGQFFIIVFQFLKWYHLVQNGRFSGQN